MLWLTRIMRTARRKRPRGFDDRLCCHRGRRLRVGGSDHGVAIGERREQEDQPLHKRRRGSAEP